jgi:Lectin C-type domain
MPRDDLSSYSNAVGAAGSLAEPPSETDDTGEGTQAPAGGEPNPDPMLPIAQGSAEPATASDAGGSPNAAPELEPDAGAPPLDAGTPADQCSRTQGTLEPGTTVCLFVASEARVSWPSALSACRARESTLVSIKTSERNDFLTTLIDTDAWTGGNDPGGNPGANQFVWRDGAPVEPIGWAPMEPDNAPNQFCILKTAEPAGPWRDRGCGELHAYACERTL